MYSNSEFIELENLGPLTTIAPGQEIVAPEDWWLFTGASIPNGEPAALDGLQGYIKRTSVP